MQYSDKVIEHFSNPHNVGEIENASGVGTVGNAKCGDIMRIYLDIDEDTKIIKDCKFLLRNQSTQLSGIIARSIMLIFLVLKSLRKMFTMARKK